MRLFVCLFVCLFVEPDFVVLFPSLVGFTIIIFIEETFSQTWFSKRTSEIKIKTNKCTEED